MRATVCAEMVSELELGSEAISGEEEPGCFSPRSPSLYMARVQKIIASFNA